MHINKYQGSGGLGESRDFSEGCSSIILMQFPSFSFQDDDDGLCITVLAPTTPSLCNVPLGPTESLLVTNDGLTVVSG